MGMWLERKHQLAHSQIFTKITIIKQRHTEGTEKYNGTFQPSAQKKSWV
jgi:hypothetical protein